MTYIQKKKEEVRNDKNSSNHPALITIPDELWNEFKKILSKEKPSKTAGIPVVSYRNVLDVILYLLRIECQWKMFPKRTWFRFHLSL